jgi:hypothetical protein
MRCKLAAIGIAFVLGTSPALAEGLNLQPVTDKATLQECGACHMVFPPQFLPARSWRAIMGNLTSHFGENAGIATQERDTIIAYLAAHAADGPKTKGGARYLKGVAATATPVQITKMPFWLRWHNEVSKARFASPQVKTAANCQACHQGASKGVFTEAEQEE